MLCISQLMRTVLEQQADGNVPSLVHDPTLKADSRSLHRCEALRTHQQQHLSLRSYLDGHIPKKALYQARSLDISVRTRDAAKGQVASEFLSPTTLLSNSIDVQSSEPTSSDYSRFKISIMTSNGLSHKGPEMKKNADGSARFDPTFTQSVIEAMGPKTSPRMREVMSSLVPHLHDFAREVELTVDEWMAGVNLLNWAGQMSNDRRNEGQLVCDVVGLES